MPLLIFVFGVCHKKKRPRVQKKKETGTGQHHEPRKTCQETHPLSSFGVELLLFYYRFHVDHYVSARIYIFIPNVSFEKNGGQTGKIQ
jgi:hypothetical protein